MDADDIVAEVFLVAWRRRADVPSPPHDRSWLFNVARAALANHRRGQARRTRLVSALSTEAHEADPPVLFSEAEFVRDLLDCLRPDERAVFDLVERQGLSRAAAAEALSISVNAVNLRLFRARRSIRLHLLQNAGVVVASQNEPGGS